MTMAHLTTPSASSAAAMAALATAASPRAPSVAVGTPHGAAPAISVATGAFSPRNGVPNGGVSHTIEYVMDELMLQYLKARGYQIAAPSTASTPHAALTPSAMATPLSTAHGDVVMASPPPLALNGAHEHRDLNNVGTALTAVGSTVVTSDERQRLLGVERIEKTARRGSASGPSENSTSVASLERYAQQLGLSTESCAANHMLFYGLTHGDPTALTDAYTKLTDWVCNSLDMYKYELHAVTFPVFVHCYLDLLAKGYAAAARSFFLQCAHDHMRLHVDELRQLSLIFTADHLRGSEYAQQVLHSKFNVHVSLLSFELLHACLSQEKLFLVLAIVNERINLIVTTNQPGMLIEQLEDVAGVDGMPSIALRDTSDSTYHTSDDVARVVASSAEPNDSEIGVPLTTGDYNLEYMVHVAGGAGKSLEDLHAIRVNWGVLPAWKLPQEPDAEGGLLDANGNKVEDDGGANGGTAGGVGGSEASGATDASKKSSTNGTSENGPADASSSNAKSGDKAGAKAGASGDKSGAGASAEAQRKAKRARLGTDADLDRRKSELDSIGPLPDRKNAFNAQLLERLVLRQPTEMKNQALEDLKVRAALSKSTLPSALCFSFVNAGGAHVNNMCFSEDVTMVGASCDDGSLRVWRNDDQPLGTTRGAVYHGELTETDEDEKTAVLRGHSSAVYGAAFSPDNRFALTSSGDSTVRLWSLAAKSNVVIYRSHEGFPVWDVRFGQYGYYFASCSMDRTARLWSTDRMTPLRVFAGHLSDVDCVEFHPNHNYIATGSSDKTVRLWDIQTGKCVRIFTGHFHGVSSLAFSSNGRYLASSGEDQYINIWDLQAGKRLETLVGHRSMVTSLSFSQESTILASSGMDSTVRLWDMQSVVDKPLHSVVAPTPHIRPTSASSAGAQAAMGSSSYVRPIHMVRPSAVDDLPSSRFLLKTLRSKQTPIYRVQFTPRNLLLSGGVFLPKVDA